MKEVDATSCFPSLTHGTNFSSHQGHNFGLKSGGTNSEGERDALGS